MKRIFSAALLLATVLLLQGTSYAQNKSILINPEKAKGSLQVTPDAAKPAITIYYTVKTAAPEYLVLILQATGGFTVNAHIVDSRGKEQMKLAPAPVLPRYVNNVDISKLVPGNYFVEVRYGDKNEASFRIPFTKG